MEGVNSDLGIDDEMPLSGLFSNADKKIEIKYVYSRGSCARLSHQAKGAGFYYVRNQGLSFALQHNCGFMLSTYESIITFRPLDQKLK